MLKLLLGGAGSGKSEQIYRRLETLADSGGQGLYLLVPEQASFESERTLLLRMGARRASAVQVLSFSRLADTVFREVGGLAGEVSDDGTRALLMSRALEQAAAVAADAGETLCGLHPRLAAGADYVEQLLSLWQELRQCAVSTEEWERVAAQLKDGNEMHTLLQEKAAGLYQVFTIYEGLAAAAGVDDLDKLTRLAERLPDSRLFDGATVFVDGFKGFTVQELHVLDALLPRVDSLTVALGSDTLGRRWPGQTAADCRREYALFAPVTDTVERLRRLAQDRGLTWETELLTENHRTEEAALAALEAGLYAPSPTVYEGDASAVTVIPCADVYEECTYVVRTIRRLLRQEGCRCRDITVVARDLGPYQGILDDLLEEADIPYYTDARRDLLCEPLVVYTRAALRLAVGGWRTEEVLRLLKTDLTPLAPVEIAELENYVYMWRLEGSAWEQEWTENPAGLGAEVTPRTARKLAMLNDRRRQVVAPLARLRRALRGAVTGRQFSTAVYEFLTYEEQLSRQVAVQHARLEELAEPVLAAHTARLWDELMGVLDRFAVALGDTPMPASRLEDLFTMLCDMMDIGTIPQGLDAVTVGAANRIRYTHPQVVFVLGANEGVFPAYPAEDGLLTEEERETLKGLGMELAGDLISQCIEERYYVYTAVTAPSKRLYISYLTEGAVAPSPLVAAVGHILPHHSTDIAFQPDGGDSEYAAEAFRRLAEQYTTPTATAVGMRQVLAEQPVFGTMLAAVDRAAERAPFRLEDQAVRQGLFGSDLCLSASQTEKFYQCRFAYFCRYGLRIKPREVAQVDAASFGTVVHYVMETLLPTYMTEGGLVETLRGEDTPAEEENALQARLMDTLQQDVRRAMDTYLREQMGGAEGKSGRFMYQMGLAQRAACNMLWHTVMELRQGAFDPVDFELNIHPEGEDGDGVLSIRLPYSAGTVQVRGKVDRVDLFVREDGTAFVRVVDYKTGTKTFELCELTAGLSMQMLLYLFIVCDNSTRYVEEGKALQPAGVLYHPLSDLVVERQGDGEQAARLQTMCMSGLVLNDPSVVLAMERKGEKNFIPVKLDKEGAPTGSVITLQQLQLLRGVVEQLLVQMGETLMQGDIAALPLQNGERLPCEYCDYRAVCGREAEDAVRPLTKRPMQAVLAELEEGEVTDDGRTPMDG